MFAAPTKGMIIVEALLSLLSPRAVIRVLEKMSAFSPRLARGRTTKQVARDTAKELVKEKSKEFGNGYGEQYKDVFSLLSQFSQFGRNHRGVRIDGYSFSQGKHVASREVGIERRGVIFSNAVRSKVFSPLAT